MPIFAFYGVPDKGEASMRLVEASSLDDAKSRAIEQIKSGTLRSIRLWDGRRAVEIHRPTEVARTSEISAVDERGARAIAMKAEGKTQRQIGVAFGISIDRVRQLMAAAASRARLRETEPNRAGLSVRARNVLLLLIVEPEDDHTDRDRRLPARVAALSRVQLFDAPNAGKGTVAEIEAWLWERGLCLAD